MGRQSSGSLGGGYETVAGGSPNLRMVGARFWGGGKRKFADEMTIADYLA